MPLSPGPPVDSMPAHPLPYWRPVYINVTVTNRGRRTVRERPAISSKARRTEPKVAQGSPRSARVSCRIAWRTVGVPPADSPDDGGLGYSTNSGSPGFQVLS